MSATSTDLATLKKGGPDDVRAAAMSATEIGFFNGPAFALASKVAQVFAASTLVPKHYQGNPGNCMIALNMAQRLGCDPLMAMQNLYVVHGTPAWSAQFLIATFNKCARFSALRYVFQGEEGKDDWGCRAAATELETGEKLQGPLITIALAKKEGWYQKAGSKWQTMPEQMLRYRAAAWFVRAYAPEIAMGLHMAEEILDAKPNDLGVYESAGPAVISVEAIKEDLKGTETTAPAPKAEIDPAPKPEPKKAKKESAPAPEAETKDTEDAPEAPPVTNRTLNDINIQLQRLGLPMNALPAGIAADFGTGDPSELSEAEGQSVLAALTGWNK